MRLMRPTMYRRLGISIPLLLALSLNGRPGEAEAPVVRYRVEQTFRLETTSARPRPGKLRPEPVTRAVEGRVRLVLEQRLEAGNPPTGRWRFTKIETEGPRSDPPEGDAARGERALDLALDWMRKLEGQEFTGALEELPVLPLGEAQPRWLARWLQWAQLGSFAGVERNPVALGEGAAYGVKWVRSEFRQVPCHVQRASWTMPVEPAEGSVPSDLAAQGVEAHTHFAAQSLEWVSRDSPRLIYAERSGVRETFWTLEGVERPELRALVFRLRLAVEVRIERLR